MTAPNSSRTGGFVLPGTGTAFGFDASSLDVGGFDVGFWTPGIEPVYDDELDNFLQQIVVGVTGLAGNLVRPRWQAEPPNDPPFDAPAWAAIGTADVVSETNAAIVHDGRSNGRDYVVVNEEIEALVSFYGRDGGATAARFRDGLQVSQNRYTLPRQLAGLVECGTRITKVPSLVNQRWRWRYDLSMTVRRQVVRPYPIYNIVEADVTTRADPSGLVDNFIVQE